MIKVDPYYNPVKYKVRVLVRRTFLHMPCARGEEDEPHYIYEHPSLN